MRIRKLAKISGLLYSQASSSSVPHESLHQTHVCQLNQSPWDVITFPHDSSSTPPYQVERDDSFTANGSLGDSIGAVESVASMKISLDDDKERVVSGCVNRRENGDGEEVKDELGFSNGSGVLCCKSDGKGWQCRREAREGHSLCDHHLAQLRNYNSMAHPGRQKTDQKSSDRAAIRRRPRTRKASSASNPHEFYYYSGFGPRWGKKRGGGGGSNAEPPKSPAVEAAPPLPSPSPPSSPPTMNRNFYYVEEDDEDDEDEVDEETGRKRGRKPIKARSLKSLM